MYKRIASTVIARAASLHSEFGHSVTTASASLLLLLLLCPFRPFGASSFTTEGRFGISDLLYIALGISEM